METQMHILDDEKFVYFLHDFLIEELEVKKNEIGIVHNKAGDIFEIQVVRIEKMGLFMRNDFNFFNPSNVGDQFDYKVCNVCQRYLPTISFSRNQNGVNNRIIRRPSCDECRVLIDGVDVPRRTKNEWERTKPNLVPFKCPICEKVTVPGLTSKVVLDHNHNNGEVRGWICDSCNTGIGRFKDDIGLLKKAIKYLED